MQILQTGFECFLLVMTVVWQEKSDNHRLEGDGWRSQNSVSDSVK